LARSRTATAPSPRDGTTGAGSGWSGGSPHVIAAWG
jgi:hypothetical protein